jgi:hypothetical protein
LVCIVSNIGDVYEGDFKSCLKHGQGHESFANGDIYIGEYANGKPEGKGIYHWNDNAVYKGFFRNGLRHGKGKQILFRNNGLYKKRCLEKEY